MIKNLNQIVSVLFFLFFFTNLIHAEGGGAVRTTPIPIESVELSEEGVSYTFDYVRLQFQLENQYYGIHVKDIEEEDVTFSSTIFDNNNLSSFEIDESFVLEAGNIKEIDFDKDGEFDISIELIKIYDHYEDVGEAVKFKIKKISSNKIAESDKIIEENQTFEDNETFGDGLNESDKKGDIIENYSSEQLTISDNKIIFKNFIDWFKSLF